MLKKVISAVEKYEMFRYNTDVAVALSGGADSVALLLALSELKEKYGLTLSAIHVNHCLRGEESDRDETFAVKLCESLGVPLTVTRIDVKGEAEKTGESIELAARNLRYEVFRNEAVGLVATAHTASDNIETALFNMTRGAGLKGMAGIPPKRDIFVRPLIFCTRDEVESYLAEKKTSFVTDSSNLTDDYTRNFLRHEVVPRLKAINPSVEKRVSDMCRTLREDDDFLTSTAKKIYTLCLKNGRLDADLLSIQHPAVIKRVISVFLFEQYDLTVDLLHLENCLKILKNGGKTELHSGYSALCERGFFFLASKEETEPEVDFLVETEEIDIKNSKINNLLLKNAIDCGKINGSPVIRNRLPSDSIRLRGRNCTKSLKKLFNEEKISINIREKLPILADDCGVVWVHRFGVSQRVAVDGETEKALIIKVKEISKNRFSGDVKNDKRK